MPDAQTERTNLRGRRQGRRPKRGNSRREQPVHQVSMPEERAPELAVSVAEPTVPSPPAAKFVRPADITPPTERLEIYCTHHMAVLPDAEPVNTRPNSEMTTLRHLPVDHFGEATLFCDCLHNGSHEWPPMLQHIETAIELDQFRTASTSDE